MSEFVHRNKLVKKKFLLAVSGGGDSVLLAHVFHDLKLEFAIAHVNYSLRGKESDGDAVFSKNLAKKLNVNFYYKKVKTKKVKGESIQMIARNIRYAFFEEILNEEKLDYVVLAHHASDQVETVLMNLFRGCGIDGLTGMEEKTGIKLRPLLDISQTDIKNAIKEKKIKHRTDSSNAKSDYKRNFLRNEVLPLIEKKWPGLEKTFLKNIENFKSLNELLPARYTVDFTTEFKINHRLFNDPVYRQSFIQSAVAQKFSGTVIQKLLAKKSTESKVLNGANGKLEFKGQHVYYVPDLAQKATPSIKLSGNTLIVKGMHADFIKNRVERISREKIKGKIRLKKWEPGNKMIPLGMHGSKKISDILADYKLSASQKENVYVLCDEEKPLWLLGLRIDNRVKLTGSEDEEGILNLQIV